LELSGRQWISFHGSKNLSRTISPGDLEKTGEEIIGAIRESQRELEKQIGHLGNQFGQIPDQLSDIEDLIKDMRAAEEAADAKRRKSIGCAQVTE
jgi:hypothetical protein